MKLLGYTPPTTPITSDGSLITQLPKRRILADKVTDQTGAGVWFDGRVFFVSNQEVVIVPVRCRASNIFGAASRMPRAAKSGLPKMQRRGNDKRLHSVLVEIVEYRK
jgi:hypothetical protein